MRVVATQLSVEQHFDAAPERIGSLIADRDFVTARLTADTGLSAPELVRFAADDRAVDLVIRGSIPRSILPGMLSGFLSADPIVTRHEAWDLSGESPRAVFDLSVDAAPVTVSGTVAVGPSGAGSTVRFDAVAQTSIAMFGDMVTTAVAKAVRTVLDAEEGFTRDYLARNP